MDEEESEIMMSPDIMSLRAALIGNLAQTVDQVHNEDAKTMILAAMECLLFTINPPRGQVQEITH